MKHRSFSWAYGAALLIISSLLLQPFLEGSWLIFLPWLVSLVFLGLPHGAVDHWVLLDLLGAKNRMRALAIIMTAYAGLAGLAIVPWFYFPQACFIAFILMTWAHWGQGDLWWSWERSRSTFPTLSRRLLFAVHRGSLPMLLPLLAAPSIYRQTAEATICCFHREADFSWLISPAFLAGTGALVASLGALSLFCSGTVEDALESLVLTLGFVLLDPLLSIGLYFCCWHGLRHLLRIKKQHPSVGGTLPILFWRAFPAVFCSLIFLVALTWEVSLRNGLWSLLGVYLVIISALTVPHFLIVIDQDLSEKKN